MTASLNRFKFLAPEHIVFILEDAQLDVAICAAHCTGRPSVIKKILERIAGIKYGILPSHLCHPFDYEIRKAQEIFINQFASIQQEDFLEFRGEHLYKTNFYIQQVDYNTLEKMYFAVLSLLYNIQSRTYPKSENARVDSLISNTKARHQQIDHNLKELYYKTLKHWLKPPNLMGEVNFFASRRHGFILPAKQYFAPDQEILADEATL